MNKDYDQLPQSVKLKVAAAMHVMAQPRPRGYGCTVKTVGVVKTVKLNGLREVLSAHLGYHPPDLMEDEVWRAIKRHVPTYFPSFVLANATTAQGGWTADWYWTNDPEKVAGHVQTHRATRVTQSTTTLPVHEAGIDAPGLAGIYALIGKLEDVYSLQMYDEVPELFRDVTAGSRHFADEGSAVVYMSRKLNSIKVGQIAYELGVAIYAAQQRAAAAATKAAPATAAKTGTP